MNNKNTKKITRKIYCFLSILAVLTLLFSCMGCSKKTPREALEEAYEKTFTKGTPTETLLGLTELTSRTKGNNSFSSGLSLSLQELSGEAVGEYAGILSGLGVNIDTASDLGNKKSAGTMDITYGGTTYLTLGGQLNDSKLFLTVPQLLAGSLSIDFSTLKEDLASDSMLAQLFSEAGLTLPENFSPDSLTSFITPDFLTNLTKFTAAYEALDQAIIVEKADKKSVALPSDVSAKNVYNVTIPKDAYVELINAAVQSLTDYSASLLEAMGETGTEELDLAEFEASVNKLADSVGDIVFTVAVTKDGYISYAESKITSEANTFTLTGTFSGKKHPLHDTEVVFEADVDDETVSISYENSFDTSSNEITFSTGIELNGMTMFTCSGEGTFTDVEKGKKYTLDFNYLEFEAANVLSVSLAGSYYVDTTKCNIPSPTGTEYHLFRMNQEDFTSLALEVITNLQKDPLLSGLLKNLDLGF